jgi:hypothetical protein
MPNYLFVQEHWVGARPGRFHWLVMIQHLIIIDLIDINKQIHLSKPPCITWNRWACTPGACM